MAVTLGIATNVTPSGFRVAIDQGTLPGDFASDRFYATLYPTVVEPDTANVTLTDGGNTYVDFTGLQQGCAYWVSCWRHLTDTSSSNVSTFDFTGYVNDTYYTTRTEHPEHDATWVETWDDMSEWTPPAAFRARSPENVNDQRAMPYDVEFGGRFIRFYPHAPNQGVGIRTARNWRNDKPFTVEYKTRWNHQGTPVPYRHWGSIAPMCAHSDYIQIASQQTGVYASRTAAGALVYTSASPEGTYPEYFGGELYLPYGLEGDVDTHRIEFDGTDQWSFYLNGTWFYTLTWQPQTHFGLWLGAIWSESEVRDFGPITTTGTPVHGFCSTGFAKYFEGEDFCTQSAKDGGSTFYVEGGGITIRPSWSLHIGTMVTAPWSHATPATYPAGTFWAKVPPSTPPTGERFSYLRYAGQDWGHGTLTLKVYDASDDSLVPDSEIPGNSTGFSPDGESVSALDLRAVSAASIYAIVSGENTAEGTTQPPVWTSVFIETEEPLLTATATDDHIALSFPAVGSGAYVERRVAG